MYEKMYPCHGGTCHDIDGDYECKCNIGRRGDGKSDKGCEPLLPKAAVATIGEALYICPMCFLKALIIAKF
jgi:hypothetical protein